MRVRIKSTGSANDTTIENAETGKRLDYVKGIELRCSVDHSWEALLHMIDVEVDVIAETRLKADELRIAELEKAIRHILKYGLILSGAHRELLNKALSNKANCASP